MVSIDITFLEDTPCPTLMNHRIQEESANISSRIMFLRVKVRTSVLISLLDLFLDVLFSKSILGKVKQLT